MRLAAGQGEGAFMIAATWGLRRIGTGSGVMVGTALGMIRLYRKRSSAIEHHARCSAGPHPASFA
jgi:hypothetical protein